MKTAQKQTAIQTAAAAMQSKDVALVNDNKPQVLRSSESVLSLLHFNTDGTLHHFEKGANLSVEEIASTVVTLSERSASVGIQAASVLRIARGLPEVTVVKGTGESLRKVTMPAYARACELVKEQATSASAFLNVQGLVELLDVVEANKLTCSPFVVKETIGYLRKVEGFDKETLKLRDSDPVAKALKDPKQAKVNAIRPVIKAAKEAKPDLFPQAAAQAAKSAPIVMTTGVSGPAPTPEVVAPKDSADAIARELKSIRGRWEKMMADSKTPRDTRKELVDRTHAELEILCKLSGFKLETLGA